MQGSVPFPVRQILQHCVMTSRANRTSITVETIEVVGIMPRAIWTGLVSRVDNQIEKSSQSHSSIYYFVGLGEGKV